MTKPQDSCLVGDTVRITNQPAQSSNLNGKKGKVVAVNVLTGERRVEVNLGLFGMEKATWWFPADQVEPR